FGPHPAGEGPRYYSVLNRFIDIAINDGTITLFGDGSQVRDYLHIDDVCRAFICAAESDEAIGLVVNVGSGCPTSMSEAARVIVDAVGHGRVEHVAWPADYAEVETGDSYFCIDRAQSVLGWNPMISFEEGIRLCVESV
ncbi:MAG: GDP-mannose 4,6-dehydratase, partial [Coriobacteriia bacterium]|nr:GDP-mannose 4,6-dehydratase [Coriobacteriia bacterium]